MKCTQTQPELKKYDTLDLGTLCFHSYKLKANKRNQKYLIFMFFLLLIEILIKYNNILIKILTGNHVRDFFFIPLNNVLIF